MNVTDITIIACSILLIYIGTSRGFLRSLLNPISFITGMILGWVCYLVTQNFLIFLSVTLFSPMIIQWLLSGLLNLWFPKEDWTPSIISQTAGALITLIWGMIFIFTVLIALAIVPGVNTWTKIMHEDISKSFCYTHLRPWVHQAFPVLEPDVEKPVSGKSPTISREHDIQSLKQDPRFKTISEDPQIQKYIAQKNYLALMNNPKVLELTKQVMQDPKLMKKFMRLSQPQSSEQNHSNN